MATTVKPDNSIADWFPQRNNPTLDRPTNDALYLAFLRIYALRDHVNGLAESLGQQLAPLALLGTGGAGGGPGGPPVVITPPPVKPPTTTVAPPIVWDPTSPSGGSNPVITVRNNDLIQVDAYYHVPGAVLAPDPDANWSGAAVFIEDPDMSTLPHVSLRGTQTLDDTSQLSSTWNPVRDVDTLASPCTVLVPAELTDRKIRIYAASYGPDSPYSLVRANTHTTTATPSIAVDIPAVSSTYVSGMEVAWLVTINCSGTPPAVEINSKYNQVPPVYSLTFNFSPPTPEEENHRPPGINPWGGVRIFYKHFATGITVDAGDHRFPPTAIVAGAILSFTSDDYPAALDSFRVYFVSEDTDGNHNQIVDGVTPSCDVNISPYVPAPDVTNLTIGPPSYQWQLDGSFAALAKISWTLPTAQAGSVRYAGLVLYRVHVEGLPGATLSIVPYSLWAQTTADDTVINLIIYELPKQPEKWVIAAISVDTYGKLADDPAGYGTPSFHSPTVVWQNIGPPPPNITSGQEYAPSVNAANATASALESTSSDGVRQVQFTVQGWVNPLVTDPNYTQFGGLSIAMVVCATPGQCPILNPTYYNVPNVVGPKGVTTFTLPVIPAPGLFGKQEEIDFYFVSQNPQGQLNALIGGVTPMVKLLYTPAQGQVVASLLPRNWFNTSEFSWPAPTTQVPNPLFTALVIEAAKIYVGDYLIVGGAPAGSGFAPSFGGTPGQVAVYGPSSTQPGGATLNAWMGEQKGQMQPGINVTSDVYGGWFRALYVGGQDPTTSPFYVNSDGLVQVGGWDVTPVLGTSNTYYPYISVRDKYNLEKGRIGASITTSWNSKDPKAGFTMHGAWFSELAIGGDDITQWNVLSLSDGTWQMRDPTMFTISYQAEYAGVGPLSQPYMIQIGSDVWDGAGLIPNKGQGAPPIWQFPGMRIFEVDQPVPTDPVSGGYLAAPQQVFGSTFLNRGMVMRGTATQGYKVIGSLVMWNGDQQGNNTPQNFWGELALYNPMSENLSCYLASGYANSTANGLVVVGDPQFVMYGADKSTHFQVDTSGNIWVRGGGQGSAKQVIDSSGNWTGNAITSGSQAKWTVDQDAGNNQLLNVSNIKSQSLTYFLTDRPGSGVPTLGIYAAGTGGGGIIVGNANDTPPSTNIQSTSIVMSDDGSGNLIFAGGGYIPSPVARTRIDANGILLRDSHNNQWIYMQSAGAGTNPVVGIGPGAGLSGGFFAYTDIWQHKIEGWNGGGQGTPLPANYTFLLESLSNGGAGGWASWGVLQLHAISAGGSDIVGFGFDASNVVAASGPSWPGTPTGWMNVMINNNWRKVPYF